MHEPTFSLDSEPEGVYIHPEMTGGQLRDLRRALDITQAELASEIGVTREAVTIWERNSRRSLSLRNFKAVRSALETIKVKRAVPKSA